MILVAVTTAAVVIVAVVIVEDTRVNIREDIAAVSTASSMTIAVVLRTFPLLPSILGGGNNFVLPIWQRPTAGRDQGRLGMNPEDADE